VEETVRVAGLELRLLRPRDLDALIDEEAFRKNEFIPYWAELWPSGRALAEALAPEVRGRVLELGCGLGVPSLVAAHRGAEVTAVDWSADAIEVLRRNAARNGVRLRAEVVDWGSPGWLVDRGPFDLVLAADVLYERRHVDPLIDLFPRLGSEVLLADPGRQALEDFLEGASDQWDIQDVAPQVVRLRARRDAR
jgi:predicted nicotinamide N-methyase